MKKIFLLPILTALLLLSSCEKDDSLDPRPVLVSGAFVRLDIKDNTKKRLNADDVANSVFAGTLTAPGNNVATYNLYIRRTDGAGNSFGEFKLIRTVTSFPYELVISPSDIATALGIQISDIAFGDNYRFYGEAFDFSGKRSDYYSLSQTIQSNLLFYKPAFRFRTDVTNTSGFNPDELKAFNNFTPQ